jgi:hypothetical protein
MWEAHMGVDYRTALKALVAGGVYLGYDAQTQGVIVLMRADNAETATKTRDFALGLIRADAVQKGKAEPFKTHEHRGVTGYELEQGMFVVADRWLATTNKTELAKAFADRFADWTEKPAERQPTLAGKAEFQSARSASKTDASAWAFADLAAIRQAGAAKELFAGRAPDNLAVELLFGGILGALAEATHASAELHVSSDGVRLALVMPHDASRIKPEREYFFGAGAAGAAPPLLTVENQLLSISSYRDASGMWLHAGDLFDENTNDQLALADSQLTTLFSGKDFGEEILGALAPESQIVVARQDLSAAPVKPDVKLPAFAGVFALKEPDVMRDELRRIFQSFIGFLNIVGAMEGQPQLDISSERSETMQIVAASYVPTEDEKKSGKGRINFNFSPTAAFVGDKFILASTEALARELAAIAAKGESPASGQQAEPANTRAVADAQVLKTVLGDNRAQLVAQNMLEEGRTQEEAERAIDGLLTLIGAVRGAQLEFKASPNMLRLEAKLDVATE